MCAGFSAHAQNAPQASVDRNSINEGDSLTLTITVEGSSDDAPDFAVLKKDFDVFGSRQSTQHSLFNGSLSSHTEWQTTLSPKHTGQIIIPELAVGAAKTQAIAIQVNAANKNAANDGSEPVFIESQVDRNAVYVQQQLLFTVRVFVAVQLEDLQLTKPEFDNASVKQLSETTFRREINGTPYAVHELTYAIFPQQAGELTIPELVFSAVEATRARSLFDFPGQGRALRRMSKQIGVHVKPIPKAFSGTVWLPARNLTLTESWSGTPQHLSAGESITRSISIRADSVLAAQLPALEQPTLNNAKIYSDQPTLDDQQDSVTTHAKRIENMALIPTQPGALHLPETRVIWWDVDSDSEKVATLNGETLNISPGAANNNQPTADAPPPVANLPTDSVTAPQVQSNTITQALGNGDTNTARIWQLVSAGFATLWLITLVLYWRARRAITPRTDNVIDQKNSSADSDAAAWQALTKACHSNDAAIARQKMLQWARVFFKRSDLRTIDQLRTLSADGAFERELQQLDNRLFGTMPDSGAWNGENLLRVITQLKKQLADKPQAEATLPPLYPVS
ncbi:MAG: hypothetical protein JWM78_524 [Verrucomicrobiaceae bacterium]|nr:hypothetical protein [Verrucomicrobiaceae bacterium]